MTDADADPAAEPRRTGTTKRASLNGAQCRAARRLLGWDHAELARVADISPITLREFENGRPLHNGVAVAIAAALEAAGVTLDGNGNVSLVVADRA